MGKRIVYLQGEGGRLLCVEVDFDPKGQPASGKVAVYREEVGYVLNEHDVEAIREGLGLPPKS